MSGSVPGINTQGQRRKQGWAEGEVGVQCSPNKGFIQPHGELWGKDGPAQFSGIGMRGMGLFILCKLSLEKGCDFG